MRFDYPSHWIVEPEEGAVHLHDRPPSAESCDFSNPQWQRKPAPYAHYVIEGSADREHWFKLADRRHGPWRGRKTDVFSPMEVTEIRFVGTFSNGAPFGVRHVQAIPAR